MMPNPNSIVFVHVDQLVTKNGKRPSSWFILRKRVKLSGTFLMKQEALLAQHLGKNL